VGVVQHRAPADWDDAAANGSAGYVKQANVVAAFDAAGFDLVKSAEINANPKDQPKVGDVVWRLPPSLNGVGDDAALKAERLAIGETDRMTLLFKKR
jgi:predicted methyltransferase